jgi:dihydroorotate dehydrogenase (NAD+) catalytic subunit
LKNTLSQALSTEFCGLQLSSPIVLLSGCVGFADEYTRVQGFSLAEVGAVCLKGTTLAPRLGNPAHRLAETPNGLLNSIGLQNPGARQVVETILPVLDHSLTHYIANISGATIEEYIEVARIFDDSAVSAIEINISCPNVKAGGVIFGNDPDMAAEVVAGCRTVTNKPLITKLSPNQTDICLTTQRCIDAGTDAFSAINTLMGMAIDIHARKPVLGNNQGGLSGPAIKPVALLKVYQIAQLCKQYQIPIIGQGGIVNGQDAIEFLLAGASLVGVGTALFYDALVCEKINLQMLDYLQQHRINCISDLVGNLQIN